MKRTIASLPIALIVLGAATPAFADGETKDPAAAQVLFYDARALMKQGKYAEACPKLEESLRLDSGLGTRFNLADCSEHIGKIATAWAGYLDVAAEAKAANQPERERVARKRAAALEPRLPKLVVDAPGARPDVEVRRDDVVIGVASRGSAIPVDPGVHRVTASTPSGKRWEVSVNVVEGKLTRVVVPSELPDGPPVASTQSSSNGVSKESAPDGALTDFPPPVVERNGTVQRTAGWAVTGLGIASVAVGAGFGLSSMSKRNESRSYCNGDACTAEGVALRDTAMNNGDIATVAMIGGGAAVLGGLVLVLTAPKNRERVGAVRAVPSFAGSAGGFLVQGSFQ